MEKARNYGVTNSDGLELAKAGKTQLHCSINVLIFYSFTSDLCWLYCVRMKPTVT